MVRLRWLRREGALTLPEVLAAVTVLGLLFGALLPLLDELYTQTVLDAQRRTAAALAESEMAKIAEIGIAAEFGAGRSKAYPPQTLGGTAYSVTASIVENPPSWVSGLATFSLPGPGPQNTFNLSDGFPSSSLTDVEVTVTWTAHMLGRSVPESLTFTQVFEH